QNMTYLKRQKPLVAYRLHGWLDKPRNVGIYYDGDVEHDGLVVETPIESYGFRLDVEPSLQGLGFISDQLEQETLVAFIVSNEDVRHLRKYCGIHVELFPFRSLNVSGTIAFVRCALLLDVLFPCYKYY